MRSLIALKPRDVPLRVALRNTVAVIAPLALGLAFDQVPAGLAMTTGAINTMFSDLPGPYRQRMRRMLMAAIAAGASALVGMLIGVHTVTLAIAALAFGFAGGLLVALGPVAARVGLTSMIVMLITADLHVPGEHAPGLALLIFAGGLLQMLLAVAAWPLQRFRPERFALAALLRQLADIARTRPDASQPPPASLAAVDALHLLHGEHRARGGAMQAFRIIAELCERARIDLLALGDLPARMNADATRAAVESVLDSADHVLRALSDALRDAAVPTRAEALLTDLQARVDALAAFDIAAPATTALAIAAHDTRDRRLLQVGVARAQSLAGQLRSLARNADRGSSRGEIRADLADARLPASLRPGNPLRTLRANLMLSSVAMRHALRCALCVAIAVICERTLAIEHGVWIPMTAAIVLKPDFGGTLRFGLLRVAGTFAGLLLTTLIAHYAMDGVALRLTLMALLCIAFRLLTQVNYGIAVAMLTGLLVLLLSFEGIAPADAIQMRVVATLLGSALALTAYALWPTWEGRRIDVALAALIDAYRRHIGAVLGGDLAVLTDTRSAARAARTGVLASMERLRAEPGRARARERREMAETLLANAHRLIRASLSLEAVLRDGATLPPSPQLATFTAQLDTTLTAIVGALQSGKPLRAASLRTVERQLADALERTGMPDAVHVALADTCDRLADSVDTLAHALRAPDLAASNVTQTAAS